MIRIALPNKGRLAEDVKVLFDEAGLPIRGRSERSLTARVGYYEALFVRAQDIPEFVADGAADLGITGWDLVTETGRPLRQLLDLEFGRCRLVVAATEDSGLTSSAQLRTGARARVLPAGPACHTGEPSCFHAAAGGDALSALARTIAARASSPQPGSYTTKLLSDRNHRLKKLGEESAELVMACVDGDAARATDDAADLVYHVLVALQPLGVTLDHVRAVLARRAR